MVVELRARSDLTRCMFSQQKIYVSNAWHLLEILDEMAGHLSQASGAYCILSISPTKFIQIKTLPDGTLRLESSASARATAAGLGLDEIVEGYEHMAGTNIPARWPSKEKVAAEAMVLLAIDVHDVEFPAYIDFELDNLDWRPTVHRLPHELPSTEHVAAV